MANILYGVNGGSSGHSTRAQEEISSIIAGGHTVHVTSFDSGANTTERRTRPWCLTGSVFEEHSMDSTKYRRTNKPARRPMIPWTRFIVLFLQVLSLAGFSFAAEPLAPTHVDEFTGRPRVIIISDIGNEPDDQMSFVRLLLVLE